MEKAKKSLKEEIRTLIVSTNRETNTWRHSSMEAAYVGNIAYPPCYEAESLGGSIWRKTTQQAGYPFIVT